jgi:hypothetical protein
MAQECFDAATAISHCRPAAALMIGGLRRGGNPMSSRLRHVVLAWLIAASWGCGRIGVGNVRAVSEPVLVNEVGPIALMVELGGVCAIDVAPDHAWIVGGIAASSLKATDAIAQLDKQLTAVRAYLSEHHGELHLLERVRTVKAPTGNPPSGADTPFEVVQRLQARLPTSAPVDVILQKLIALGLDRFGDNVLFEGGSRREVIVRFRVDDFDDKIEELRKRCTADAWRRHCAETRPACAADSVPANLQLQSFEVHSEEALLRPNDGAAPWQFDHSRGSHAAEPPDLLGNVTVHLRGAILLLLRDAKH